MHITRIYADLNKYIKSGKVLVIYGPRQVGKTTLLKDFLAETKMKYRLDSGENIRVQEVFSDNNFKKIKEYTHGYELVVIDEAQKIKNIGQGLKILVDESPSLKVVVTGSSSFDLAGQVGEPLTGRKKTLVLYPVSQIEMHNQFNNFDLQEKLEEFLIYGSYPEIIAADSDGAKKRLITEITDSYLLKDILELDKIRNSKILLDLLRLLAFQIGSEVSFSELGKKVGLDYKTVARYIDILEKSFVLFNLRGFSRNLRKEVTRKSKYFFYDLGIRNSLISNFNSLNLRDDVGKLWENFVVMERIKKQKYTELYSNNYFWRTHNGQEIDFVEERDGQIHGYEIKWGNVKKTAPSAWKENYPSASYKVVNLENYLAFIALS